MDCDKDNFDGVDEGSLNERNQHTTNSEIEIVNLIGAATGNFGQDEVNSCESIENMALDNKV
jgi:hypothetical protein